MKILFNTLLSNILNSLVLAIVFSYGKEEMDRIIYALVLIFFCTLLPTFLAALVYEFVKKRFLNNQRYAFLFGSLILFFIFQFCLVLCVVVDVCAFRPPLTINAVIDDYRSEFAVINIPAGLLALFIPLVDLLIERVRLDLKNVRRS